MTAAASSPFRRQLRNAAYISFRHAQGNQVSQLHFLQCYTRYLRDDGVAYDPLARTELAAAARSARLPAGHLAIPDAGLVAAQFAFWWELGCDVVDAAYQRDHRLLPTGDLLRRRIAEAGGSPEMSSFREEEMAELFTALDGYRSAGSDALGPIEVVERLFLPQVIQVELGFQGAGQRYPSRPRTDGGDPHESLLRLYCRQARERARAGTAGIVDRIYLDVCRRLDVAGNASYGQLVRAYNANHPGAELVDLHRDPEDADGYRTSAAMPAL